ncbi:MAG: hypothetical protein ACFHX7_23555 [Pseudomonadota bacterium]
MKLVIGIDLGGLASYLALGSVITLLDETGVEAVWQPLVRESAASEAASIDGEDPLAAYKARRQRARDQWAARELARNCERLGIGIARGGRRFDATLLNLGLLLVRATGGDCQAYLQRAFRAAFVDGDDVENLARVAELVAAAGFADFCEDHGKRQLRDESAALNEQGLVVAPGFVCDGEVFQGRQHLPMIRWIIQGRQGTPPV